MKNAIITCADDNFIKNLILDFFPTLRAVAKYHGPVYVIFYGKNKKEARELEKKYGAKIVFSSPEKSIVNQRNIELVEVIDNLPKKIKQVMCIDSDVWFQSSIDEIFKITKNSYGFVEEDQAADEGFNLLCINQINDQSARNIFLKKAKGYKLAGAGMIAGERAKVRKILGAIVETTKAIKQDFFGLDQAIFNYLVRVDGKGIRLDKKYDYSLITNPNQFDIRGGLFFENTGGLINIVHNSGSTSRLFPNGRKDLMPTPMSFQKLTGDFWGITVFFNPARYRNKIKNYRIFRLKSRKQGLKLLAVELAFGNRKFELKKNDADILIQLRTNTVLWQKERLINIGIENLPDNCDKFGWIDCDIVFCNDSWVGETSRLLEKYAIIQPFSTSIRLSKRSLHIRPDDVPFGSLPDMEEYKSYGLACRVSQLGRPVLNRTMETYGLSGFAWAARRDIFKGIGLFDINIYSPASDLLMAYAFYDIKGFNKEVNFFINDKIKRHFVIWAEKVRKKIKNSVYFTNGTVLHLWHGSLSNRNYPECVRILKDNDFDPEKDIALGKNGCWEWASNKKKLHDEIERYFLLRNEEGYFRVNFLPIFRGLKGSFSALKYNLLMKLNRVAGIFGIFLKKISPTAYSKLKKIEYWLKSLAVKQKSLPD